MESLSNFLGIASICILLNLTWTLIFRRHLYHLYTNHKDKGIWKYLLDPSEHLMGWWDSPYMRMYSYQVTTSSGERLSFPVTKFSPYDTFITDIHTHMMILGRDWDIDSTLNSDRTQTRNGVWGLIVDPSYRDPMYKIMDDAKQGDFELDRLDPFKSKCISLSSQKTHESMNLESKTKLAFRNFFEAWNAYQKNKIFNFLSKWPHFPGEDLVPDISPLVPIKLPKYTQGQISQFHISCIKTFYTRNQIHLIENSHVATIDIPTP